MNCLIRFVNTSQAVQIRKGDITHYLSVIHRLTISDVPFSAPGLLDPTLLMKLDCDIDCSHQVSQYDTDNIQRDAAKSSRDLRRTHSYLPWLSTLATSLRGISSNTPF